MLQMMRKNEAPYRLSGLIWTLGLKTENHRKSNTTRCLPKNEVQTDTLKNETSDKQAEKETERKCVRQEKAKKEAEHMLWQNYKERQNNTNARVK